MNAVCIKAVGITIEPVIDKLPGQIPEEYPDRVEPLNILIFTLMFSPGYLPASDQTHDKEKERHENYGDNKCYDGIHNPLEQIEKHVKD